ncbi:MAG TPA: condensation domain-containing protein, partial [Terracidiphilus sp.]|nr:condensation domain-containing protein [Terracidiphilus sp.]
MAREAGPGDQRLVAYYTVETADAGAESLRAHLAAKLPDYMVPAAYVRLEALPLTANGKLDRKALPAPEGDAYSTRGYEAPQGEVESRLAEIWAEVLKLERVGRHDNFFSLGGHSLLAVTLIERMRRSGFRVDVRTLFATPTIAALSAMAETAAVEVPPNRIPFECQAITPDMLPLLEVSEQEIERIVSTVPGGAANVQDIYPLAPLQEGILFHHLMGGEGDPYLLALQLRFDSRARLDSYVRALQAVVERHDILRTAVLWEGVRQPVQVVWRRAALAMQEVELDGMTEAAEQLQAQFDPRHFRIDVRQAPLLRLYAAREGGNGRWVMTMLLHHLCGDHTTLEMMQAEVQAQLLGDTEALAAPLPFRNLVAQARLGVSQAEHEAFFRRMLGDIEEPSAPFGLLDVQSDGCGIEQAHLLLESELAGAVRASARRLGVSAASVCHLAWAQVLARVSGRADVVFGTVLFGRMQGGESADRVMGLFINTLPVRIRVGGESAAAAVEHTHRLLADLLRHEHASLALAQRCSRVAAPAPLFSALLNYRHTAQGRSAEARRAWEGIEVLGGEERTNYPVTLSVEDFGEAFGLTAQTPEWVGPRRVCEFMQAALVSLVTALETGAATPVRALEVLPPAERAQVLYEWNSTQVEFPGGACLHELFEQQVERTPEATALVFEGRSLGYGELNARANRLAHY